MSAPYPAQTAAAKPSWKAKIGLSLLGLVVTVLLLEGGLRVASGLRDSSTNEGWDTKQSSSSQYWAIYDPDLGYRHNPEFGDFNSEGLRDHAIAAKDDRFRVLILGDSVAVYGDTVDDTFVGHLRAALRGGPDYEHVEVINAGMKGYTNYQEVAYLKKYALKFQPDLVGVEFCLNDLFKFLHSFRVENGRLVPGTYEFSSEAVQQAPGRLRRWAAKSFLLVWLRNNLPVAASVAEWQATQGYSFDYRLDVRTAWQGAPWQQIERQLQELADLGRQHHFNVFLTVVPLAVQYEADYLARDRDYVLKPQRRLKEICERLGIPFYDLYLDMNAGLFVPDGIHLTPSGRRVVGEKMAAFLRRSGLLLGRGAGARRNN